MISIRSLACLAVFAALATPLRAQTSVATVPVGYFTLTIAAGSGDGFTPSVLAFPLQGITTASGQMAGLVSSVTASTITNSNANWVAGQLSQAATPYIFEFTSGNACGRTFLLATNPANTATTVTLASAEAVSTDLTTLGITSSDTYQIFPADTIISVLGTPSTTGVLGGNSSVTNCDLVQLLSTSGWTSYYYDNSSNHWLRVSPPHTVSDNVAIRPDTGVIYSRFAATPISIMLTGRVPAVQRQAAVYNSGPTLLSNSWPADLTLATSSIQTMPGWTPGTSASVSDTVQIFGEATGWRTYYYNNNSNHWLLASPPYKVSDSVSLPAGSVVIINKLGSASGQTILSQALPYSLATSP